MSETQDLFAVKQAQAEGRHNVEIFLNALEKSCRAVRMYAHQTDDGPIAHIFENLHGALDRALGLNDKIEVQVKQTELLFENRAVYTNKERKTSMALALHEDGVKALIFERGLDVAGLRLLSSILGTDFTKPENMDADLYSLFIEAEILHFVVVGADTLAELQTQNESLKTLMEAWMHQVQNKAATKVDHPRRLRPDDVKALEEFRLQPQQFHQKSDEEVQKLVVMVNAQRAAPTAEKETLEKLLLMGFDFLLSAKDEESMRLGRDLVCRVCLMTLQSEQFTLLEAVLKNLNNLQQQRFELSGECQKIVDYAFHIDHEPIFRQILTTTENHQPVARLLLGAPPMGMRLVIRLLGTSPWLTKILAEPLLKHVGTISAWLLEEVERQPDYPGWEALVNLMALRPTVTFQKFLESLLSRCGSTLRLKVLKQLAQIGTPEALAPLGPMLAAKKDEERKLAVETLASSRSKHGLILLREYLESPVFAGADEDEKELAYGTLALMGGEAAAPWLERLWFAETGGFFKKKADWERRHILTRALAKHRMPLLEALLAKTDAGLLSPETHQEIQKARARKPSGSTS